MENRLWDEETIARRLQIATEAAQIGLWDWNMLTGEMVYSRRAKLICGFDPDRPVSFEMARAVTHPEDLPRTQAMSRRAMDPVLKEREPYRYRIVRPDGQVRWVLAYGQAIFEGSAGHERCVAYTGTIQDITDAKRKEDQLLESEARLRLALDAARIAVWETNLTTGSVTHSPELNRLCGFPPEATPTLEEFRARYAPGEYDRLQALGAELAARGETRVETELRMIWPDGTPKWLRLRAQQVPTDDGSQRVIGVLYDTTERRQAEERNVLIARELKHRLKNTLAILQSIASQSIRGHADPEDGLAALNGRLHALAAAASTVSEEDWEHLSLRELIDRVFAPHHDGDAGTRFRIEGEDITLSPSFASTLALGLHELATNAAKYGALSVPDGRVSVSWNLDSDRRFSLQWREEGGPPVTPPRAAGFGTRLLERALFTPFDGHAALTHEADGVRCRIVATMPN